MSRMTNAEKGRMKKGHRFPQAFPWEGKVSSVSETDEVSLIRDREFRFNKEVADGNQRCFLLRGRSKLSFFLLKLPQQRHLIGQPDG